MNFLLPFKGLRAAKTRWPDLGEKRQDLVLRLLLDNISIVSKTVGADKVFLLSPEDDAEGHFAHINLIHTPGRGLNEDLRFARSILTERFPSEGLAVLLPDLPNLTEEDLQALLQAALSHNVVLCPDEQDFGTNVLLLNSPEAIDFSFEGASFARHREACLKREQSHFILRRPGLAQDCDNLEDLEKYSLL